MQETEKVAQTAHDRATRLVSLMVQQEHLTRSMRALTRQLENVDRETDQLAEEVRKDLDGMPDPNAAVQVDHVDPDRPTLRQSYVLHSSHGIVRIRPLVHSLRAFGSPGRRGPSVAQTPQGLIRLDRACEVPCDGPCECNDGPPAGVVESFALPTGTR